MSSITPCIVFSTMSLVLAILQDCHMISPIFYLDYIIIVPMKAMRAFSVMSCTLIWARNQVTDRSPDVILYQNNLIIYLNLSKHNIWTSCWSPLYWVRAVKSCGMFCKWKNRMLFNSRGSERLMVLTGRSTAGNTANRYADYHQHSRGDHPLHFYGSLRFSLEDISPEHEKNPLETSVCCI